MPFSDIFHQECDPIEPADSPSHVVFSCLQWKTPSLMVMPLAAKQCFAVIYGDPSNPLSPYISTALERAYILGAMSAVKLIAVHEDSLYLFLDSGVSSAIFQEIKSLWMQVMSMSHTRLTVDFVNVAEAYSGHSDYSFSRLAKEILEFNSLGIEPYDLKSLDDLSDTGLIEEDLRFRRSLEDSQSRIINHCSDKIPDIARMKGHFKCINAPYFIYPVIHKPNA